MAIMYVAMVNKNTKPHIFSHGNIQSSEIFMIINSIGFSVISNLESYRRVLTTERLLLASQL